MNVDCPAWRRRIVGLHVGQAAWQDSDAAGKLWAIGRCHTVTIAWMLVTDRHTAGCPTPPDKHLYSMRCLQEVEVPDPAGRPRSAPGLGKPASRDISETSRDFRS